MPMPLYLSPNSPPYLDVSVGMMELGSQRLSHGKRTVTLVGAGGGGVQNNYKVGAVTVPCSIIRLWCMNLRHKCLYLTA